MTWREKLHHLLMGAASITGGRVRRRAPKTPEEWAAWANAITNDPERVKARAKLAPAMYVKRRRDNDEAV